MQARVEASDLVPNKICRNIDVNKDGKIDGFQFALRNLFYTAEPIGSIKNLFVKVDGEELDPRNLILVVRGQEIPVLNAPTIYEIWWSTYEDILVFVERPDGLEAGNHELECTLQMTTTSVYGREFHDAKGTPYREYFTKTTVTVT